MYTNKILKEKDENLKSLVLREWFEHERQRKPIMSVLINLSTRQISLSSSRVEFLLYPFSQFFFFFLCSPRLVFWFSCQQRWIKVLCFFFSSSALFFFVHFLPTVANNRFQYYAKPTLLFHTFLGFILCFFYLVLHKQCLSGSEMTCVCYDFQPVWFH